LDGAQEVLPGIITSAVWDFSCYVQMLVEAQTADGLQHSTLLQNAETVRLVGSMSTNTSSHGSSSSSRGDLHSAAASSSSSSAAAAAAAATWRVISVAELQPGDQVYLLRQAGARHTGISIQEQINER
jgi:3-dehydroquinate synthase class II